MDRVLDVTPTDHDVGLIGASHASRGGRITNVTCRPKRSGDSSDAGAGSTKRCFGVQSGQPKERCDRTRERTAINRPSHEASFPQHGDILTRFRRHRVDEQGAHRRPLHPAQPFSVFRRRKNVNAPRELLAKPTSTQPLNNDAPHTQQNTGSPVTVERTRRHHGKTRRTQEQRYLTGQPLSEMSNRPQFLADCGRSLSPTAHSAVI